MREEIRRYNCQLIHTTIENNKSIKKVKQKLMTSKKRLFRIQKEDGSTTSNKHEVLERVKEFYSSLYGDTADQIALENVEETNAPAVFPDELRSVTQNLKNGKAACQDEIAGEILKSCGSETDKALAYLFTQCLKHRDIPSSWKDAKVILLHQKGNQEDMKNYRPISILSVIY